MVKEDLCEKVVEIRRVSDSDDRCSFLRGFAEVDFLACSAKWNDMWPFATEWLQTICFVNFSIRRGKVSNFS